MQVITDAKELEKHTYIKTRNPAVFPKKERLGLAQRMMNEASDLVADLMEANDLLLTDPEEREMLVRLYAGEIIMGRITEDNVPAKLKARVHKYLVDMGYFDDVEE